jgi:predicted esterase
MAWRVALRNPRRFAGVVSLSGALPSGGAPLAQLEAIRRLSVFIGCSRDSQSYPSASVCDDLRLLHTAGMSIVLREYPGEESLTAPMLADMDRWMMDQIAGGAAQSMAASR